MPSADGEPAPTRSPVVAPRHRSAGSGDRAGARGDPAFKIGVLGLQGDFAEHLEALARIGVDGVDVRRREQLEDVDGLIIPGGESTTIGRLADLYGLTEKIRERVAAGMPVWGTCAGAILLAKRVPGRPQSLLGLMDITVERNAFGRQIDSFEADLEVKELGDEPFHAVFIRAPKIVEASPGVDVLARLEDGTIVAAQEGRLLATSFHPELTPDGRFHHYFCSLVGMRHTIRAGER